VIRLPCPGAQNFPMRTKEIDKWSLHMIFQWSFQELRWHLILSFFEGAPEKWKNS
jgi:hypothetical protein